MARSLYPGCAYRDSGLGARIKITVWLATRERSTWIAAVEVLVLALVLFFDPGSTVRLLVGLPLLAHLGYRAMTSLPMGAIPGRPSRAQHRRNQDLRSRVVGFLNQVRHVEDYAQRATAAGWPRGEVDKNLRSAKERLMAAAAELVEATGRTTSAPAVPPTTARSVGPTRGRSAPRPLGGMTPPR